MGKTPAHITVVETSRVSSMDSWAAPSPDTIHPKWLKKLLPLNEWLAPWVLIDRTNSEPPEMGYLIQPSMNNILERL